MKTVIEMAKESGFTADEFAWHDHMFERFAELVRADEREACADLCYQLVDNSRETRFATAIRARNEQ